MKITESRLREIIRSVINEEASVNLSEKLSWLSQDNLTTLHNLWKKEDHEEFHEAISDICHEHWKSTGERPNEHDLSFDLESYFSSLDSFITM